MGEPSQSHVWLPTPEHIGRVEGTRGSETSQYPQEEKTTCDSVSSGERKRMRVNRVACDSRQALRHRGSGTTWILLPKDRKVKKLCVSRMAWKSRP
jgi:hypothetical protein